jgi:TatD DNase family protein
MNVKYVDAHCHLQFEQYAQDREDIIARMREEGIAAIVIGTDIETSKQALALAEAHEHLFASVGMHPSYAGGGQTDLEPYRMLAESPKVVAIGECGLDYFRQAEMGAEVKHAQGDALRAHIKLAEELDKPLIIHARPSRGTMDAYHDLLDILKSAKREHPNVRGDIHFFAGGIQEADAFVALGFMISFTAVITFARDYDEVVRAAPLASILAETDAPYVAPASRRGTRNDPLAVAEVAATIASIRGEDPELVRAALLANARRLFSLPDNKQT